MHRQDRIDLARRLFGEGRGTPGPLRPEWVRERFDISPQTLMKWRSRGVPADRVDDVMAVLDELGGKRKSGLPSEDDRPLMRSDLVEMIDAMTKSGHLDATARDLLDAVLSALAPPPPASQVRGKPQN